MANVIFDVWIGGQMCYYPEIIYWGGTRHVIPDIDVDKLSWFNLWDIYKQLKGPGTNVEVYSKRPGHRLDNGLLSLKNDQDLMKLVLEYDGLLVIPLYFEEKPGPILALDTDGNILSTDPPLPQLTYSREKTQQGDENQEDQEDDATQEITENDRLYRSRNSHVGEPSIADIDEEIASETRDDDSQSSIENGNMDHYFEVVITKSNYDKNIMNIPKDFFSGPVRDELIRGKCKVELFMDGKRWTVEVNKHKDRRVLKKGLLTFLEDNGLFQGQKCRFTMINEGVVGFNVQLR